MIYIIYDIQRYLFEYMLKLLYYTHMFWLYIINLFHFNYETSIIYIKDNKIITNEQEQEQSQADFFVKIYKNEKNKNIIKVSNDYSILTLPEIKLCNYNFILVFLKVLDRNTNEYYKIDITHNLKNSNITYYTEDAILFDNNFYTWLILENLKKLDIINIQGVDIIDQYAEHISITNKQYIKLKIDEYIICETKE